MLVHLFSLSLSTLCINWRRVNDGGDIIYQFSYLALLRKNNDALGFNKNVISFYCCPRYIAIEICDSVSLRFCAGKH